MIDVEIRGSIAKKEYEKLKKMLEAAGEHVRTEHRITLAYTDRGFNNRAVRLEHKNGAVTLYIETGKVGERKELATELARGAFTAGVHMLAELGYKKGTVSAEEVLSGTYGGASFALFDPGDDSLYYEASMSARGATDAGEAKQKLEKLAKTFKLPLWTPLDMLAFIRKVHERTNYVYDYTEQGAEHFREKFGM